MKSSSLLWPILHARNLRQELFTIIANLIFNHPLFFSLLNLWCSVDVAQIESCRTAVCLVMKPFHHSFYLVESNFCFHRKMTHCSPGSFSGHCNPGFDGEVKETRVRSGRSSWNGSERSDSGEHSVHVIAPFVNTFLTCMKVSNGVVCVVVTQVVSNIFHQVPSNALRACGGSKVKCFILFQLFVFWVFASASHRSDALGRQSKWRGSYAWIH